LSAHPKLKRIYRALQVNQIYSGFQIFNTIIKIIKALIKHFLFMSAIQLPSNVTHSKRPLNICCGARNAGIKVIMLYTYTCGFFKTYSNQNHSPHTTTLKASNEAEY
jgi:hypothetical protein